MQPAVTGDQPGRVRGQLPGAAGGSGDQCGLALQIDHEKLRQTLDETRGVEHRDHKEHGQRLDYRDGEDVAIRLTVRQARDGQ